LRGKVSESTSSSTTSRKRNDPSSTKRIRDRSSDEKLSTGERAEDYLARCLSVLFSAIHNKKITSSWITVRNPSGVSTLIDDLWGNSGVKEKEPRPSGRSLWLSYVVRVLERNIEGKSSVGKVMSSSTNFTLTGKRQVLQSIPSNGRESGFGKQNH